MWQNSHNSFKNCHNVTNKMRNDLVLFKYFSHNDKAGVVSYVVNKYTNLPIFIRNSELSNDLTFSPRESYSKEENSYYYDTKNKEDPFLTIDFGKKMSFLIHFYSLSFYKGYSPPTQWDISGSDDNKKWEPISQPKENISLCLNGSSSYLSRCGNNVTISYECKSNAKAFRYIRYRVIYDRYRLFINPDFPPMLRLGRIELFGDLFTRTRQCKTYRRNTFLSSSFVRVLSYTFLLK